MGRTSTRQSRLPRGGQPGIQNFARATKHGVSTPSTPNSREDGKKCLAPAATSRPPVSPSKKRKLHELENVQECVVQTHELAEKTDPETTLTPSKCLKIGALPVSTPRSGHYASSSPSKHPTAAPTEQTITQSTLSKCESTKTKARRRGSHQISFVLSASRPACVEELVRLHSAFLKALTFHAAHHGTSAPADLKEFLPSVERIWKKRKVVVTDIQRLLWIWGERCGSDSSSVFRLANHGLGRVCLERTTERTEWVDEAELQAQFEQTVDLLWEKSLDSAEGDESRVDFMASLGLVSIQDSLAPFTTFRKGQQRLQDLKGGVVKLKMDMLRTESASNGSTTPHKKATDATITRRQGLLNRIKKKELLQAKLPPPPSKETLLRRAAVERVEEVAAVLARLRPAGYVGSGPTARMAVQRTPFCLETIIQNVQNSTRNPISEQEVEACLEILSREDVAGHWVNIVVVNQLKSVVLRSSGDVQPREIGVRVSQLGIGWETSPKISS
ncbi:DNA replication factor Cdt1 C-terminal domain-containing protein [Aspergillus lucknowensis]|uniref:DNA replication factor Cdt1 C-terminal domain-containing protein n=1 Tax=Aspergillus lucknowensis TaxID=176173 RepID=A0ABR4LUY0_9EURO